MEALMDPRDEMLGELRGELERVRCELDDERANMVSLQSALDVVAAFVNMDLTPPRPEWTG
jgi:hypothetical protein